MIRPATPEDYKPIAEMLSDFHAAAGQAYTAFDAASAENWVTVLATAPFGTVIVAEEEPPPHPVAPPPTLPRPTGEEPAPLGAGEEINSGRLTGVIGGVVVPVFVNHAQNMAQESFMWVRPEARRAGTASALIQALEAWAFIRGAKTLTMVSFHGSAHETVGALYRKLGYAPLEYHFIKTLP